MFLHDRCINPAVIRSLVDTHARESESLEFKGPFWKNEAKRPATEEAGKDVAAFANALGGDILVGVVDGGGHAARFSDEPLPANARKELDDLLQVSLSPVSVMNTIKVEAVDCEDSGGRRRTVLVVSVPPWPHGPVCVRRAEGIRAFSFPYRSGADTRFMEMDEMLARAEAGRRSTYLKLLALKGGQTPEVTLIGEISWQLRGLSGVLGQRVRHGRLTAVTESVVQMEMYLIDDVAGAASRARALALAGRFAKRGLTGQAWAINEDDARQDLEQATGEVSAALSEQNPMLVIPISLVADVWGGGSPPTMHMLLRGGIRFVDDRWMPSHVL